MIRHFFRLRSWVPFAQLDALIDQYWEFFWRQEERQEEQEAGGSPRPPIRGSERAVLIEQIAAAYPFRSLLEVGCGYGQNFHILSRLFPTVRFVGLDRDHLRIREGQQLVQQRGHTGVQLVQGNARDLSDFPDESADIVVACAMLLLVGPQDIETVIREMLRVARNAVLVLEQHQPDPANAQQHLGVQVSSPSGGFWLRDYQQLFRRFVPEASIHKFAVPRPRWEIELWRQYAAVFRINK